MKLLFDAARVGVFADAEVARRMVYISFRAAASRRKAGLPIAAGRYLSARRAASGQELSGLWNYVTSALFCFGTLEGE